jgi:glutaminyl-peptide cyclotransferase
VSTVILAALACRGDAQKGASARDAGKATTTSTGFNGNAAYNYAKTQFDFGPRVPGTLAAQRAGDWIIGQMRARADTVIVQSFTYTTAQGKKLTLRNILARFRPDLKDRVLYMTHWDSRPIAESAATDADRKLPTPGANDGASGVGMFVALGDILKKIKTDRWRRPAFHGWRGLR